VRKASLSESSLFLRFNEAMHFCSDMPFHMKPGARPNVALPIYAVGAALLWEVLGILGVTVEPERDAKAGLARLATKGKEPWRFEA
jgi:hypothetical protein